MINSKKIYTDANRLIQRHGTRDTLALAKATGIDVVYSNDLGSLLGMYVNCLRHRAMFLNTKMDACMTQMVAGHEMAHDIYHRELAKTGFQEYALFNMKNQTEYEANAFAAHVLIDTDECLEYIRNGYDIFQLAQATNSEINLMMIKLQEMSRLGYDIRIPMEPKSDFFKNIKAQSTPCCL